MSRCVLSLVLLASLPLAACKPAPEPGVEEALRTMDEARDDMRKKAQAQAASGELVDVSAENERMRQSVEKAAASATGEDAAVLRASAKVMKLIEDSTAGHQQALQAFLAAGGLDPAGLTDAASVTQRRGKLDAFCESNRGLSRTISVIPEEYGRIARAEGAGEQASQAAVQGFLSTFPQATLLRLRKLDGDFCTHAGAHLKLLGDHAGRWTAGPDGILFDDTVPDTVLDDLNATIAAIESVGAEQTALQQQLLAR